MQPSDAALAPGSAGAWAGRRRHAVAGLAIVLAVAALARFGVSREGVVAAFVVAVLVVLSAIDLERRILPNKIVLPAAALVLPVQLALAPDRAVEWMLAPFSAALLLSLPLVVNRDAIGLGDVKLALLLGAALGYDVFGALALGFILLFPVALGYALRNRGAVRGAALPFGPFLAAGTVLTLLAGTS